jgi:acetyl esterase/lipase
MRYAASDMLHRTPSLMLFMLALSTASFAQTSFYSTADIDLDAYENGGLLRWEPIDGAPAGATAYRVLYKSEGLRGEAIAVSGVVIVPAGAAPAGGRKIVAWAHPTTGVMPKCAPSLARGLFPSIQGLEEMLQRGYVVAATDYPGLGTAGPHPYLVGISEGRSVLDSVRVARQIPGAGTGRAFAAWGHSQGGHAVLYAGILARTYAPELQLTGVAAAAPATDLGLLVTGNVNSSGGKNVTAAALWSWSQVYGLPISSIVAPQAIPDVNRLVGDGIEKLFDVIERRSPSTELEHSFLKVESLTDLEPWRSLISCNSPGMLPPTVPVFLAQGMKDTLVLPEVTENYMQRLSKDGVAVQWHPMAGSGHLSAARDSADAAIAWMADRFNGLPAPGRYTA